MCIRDRSFPATCIDVVLMGRYNNLKPFRFTKKADLAAARHYLKLVGMEGFEKRQIGQLSEGQKQRIFFARALMMEGDIYFLDEPFAGVDMATEKVLVDLLKKLQKQEKTIITIHHDLHTASKYFDYCLALNMRLVSAGQVESVLQEDVLKKMYGSGKILLKEASEKAGSKSLGAL